MLRHRIASFSFPPPSLVTQRANNNGRYVGEGTRNLWNFIYEDLPWKFCKRGHGGGTVPRAELRGQLAEGGRTCVLCGRSARFPFRSGSLVVSATRN